MSKHMIPVLLSILIVSMVIGCSSSGGAGIYTDEGKTITAKAGGEFVIVLDSNPTTGYEWQEKHDDAMVKLVDSKYEPGQNAKKGMVGAGGAHYFRFKALKAGATQITLTYKRSWEQESAEQKVFNVSIE